MYSRNVRASKGGLQRVEHWKDSGHFVERWGSIALVSKRFYRLLKVTDPLVRLCVDRDPLFCEIFLFAKGCACPTRKSDRRFIRRHSVRSLELGKEVSSLISHKIT